MDLDIAEVHQQLLNFGVLAPQDYIRNYYLDFEGASTASYSVTTSSKKIGKNMLLNDTVLQFNEATLRNQQFSQTFFSVEFCNVTYGQGQTSLSGTTVDFFYTTSKLNAFPHVRFGRINETWASPFGSHDLPMGTNQPNSIIFTL